MFVKIKENLFCESRLPWPKVRFYCEEFNDENESTTLKATVFSPLSKTNFLVWSAPLKVKYSGYLDSQKAFDAAENALYSKYLNVKDCEHAFQSNNNNSLMECMGSAACKKCGLMLENYFMDKRTFDSMKFSEIAHKDERREFSGELYFNHPKAVYSKIYSVFKTHRLNPEIIDLFCACFEHDIVENCPKEVSDKIIVISGKVVLALVLEVTNPSINYPNLSRQEKVEINCVHIEGASVLAKILKMADRICNLKDFRLCKDLERMAQYQKETEILIKHLEKGLSQQKQDPYYIKYKDEISELMDELCFISQKVKHLTEHKENFFIEIPQG